jgi:hypothetical protein
MASVPGNGAARVVNPGRPAEARMPLPTWFAPGIADVAVGDGRCGERGCPGRGEHGEIAALPIAVGCPTATERMATPGPVVFPERWNPLVKNGDGHAERA